MTVQKLVVMSDLDGLNYDVTDAGPTAMFWQTCSSNNAVEHAFIWPPASQSFRLCFCPLLRAIVVATASGILPNGRGVSAAAPLPPSLAAIPIPPNGGVEGRVGVSDRRCSISITH